MGLTTSSEVADPNANGGINFNSNEPDEFIDKPVGYRVLGIQKDSPSADKFVPFLDIIVGANNVRLKEDDGTFYEMIEESENKMLDLVVYNTKNKQKRQVLCKPNSNWPGEGLLGLTIKFDSFQDADDAVFHILEVEPNSPAENAGLRPHEDFLLGTPRYILTSLSELNELLTGNLNNPIEFFVYSQNTDIVRTVTIKPTLGWGGKGVLGCGVGHGYLHRLPKKTQHSIGSGRKEDYLRIQRSSANDITTGKLVNTPLGKGELHGVKANGLCVVKLDWDLHNDATAMAYLKVSSIKKLTEQES